MINNFFIPSSNVYITSFTDPPSASNVHEIQWLPDPPPWHPPWPATFETAHCDSFVTNRLTWPGWTAFPRIPLSCMCPLRVGYKRDFLTRAEGWTRSSHFGVWVCKCVWPRVHCYCWADVPHGQGVAVGPEIALFPWVFCQGLWLCTSGVCLATW